MIGPRSSPPTLVVRIDANYDQSAQGRTLDEIVARITSLVAALTTTESIVLMGGRGRPVIAPRDSFARIRSNNQSLQFKDLATVLATSFGESALPVEVGLLTVQIPAYQITPQIRLVENLMFDPRELANDQVLARQLAALGYKYIIDDIRSLNESIASIASVPKCIPTSLSSAVQSEFAVLDRLALSPNRPFVALVGGSHVPRKLALIRRLAGSADEILVGGAVANVFLAARGVDIQRTVVSRSDIDAAKQLDGIVGSRLVLPTDFVWRMGRIMDIGTGTRTRFVRSINDAQSLLFSGPMGVISTQLEAFQFGSVAMAEAVVAATAPTKIVLGDETIGLLAKLPQNETVIRCIGDAAAVDYLAGQKLVGLEAIQRSRYTQRTVN